MYAGGHRRPIELCPTKLSMVSLGYPGWSPGRTCTRFETVWLSWDVANPRTTKPVFNCIRTFLRTSLLTGFKPMYGFRNLIYCWLRQMEQLHLARMVNEFFFIVSHAESSTSSCQALLDCFCTWDAFHISNSIRCFWASVSLIPLSDKVVWALRGKPF